MFVKTFDGHSIEEVIAQIKLEMGPDALVMRTEKVEGGLFSKTKFNITAAVDKRTNAQAEVSEADLEAIFPHRKMQKREQLFDGEDKKTPGSQKQFRMSQEEKHFLDIGMSAEIAKELGARMVMEYSRGDLAKPASAHLARVRLLSEGLRVSSFDSVQQGDTLLVIGSSGVGRTSVAVKLGVELKKRFPVTLVGRNNRKLMGGPELQAYAEALKIQYQKEMSFGAGGNRVQIVDTPPLESMELLEAFSQLQVPRLRVILVVDQRSRLNEMQSQLSASKAFGVSSVIFTHGDCVRQRAVVYEFSRFSKTAVAAISASAKITDPLTFPTVKGLADFILGFDRSARQWGQV